MVETKYQSTEILAPLQGSRKLSGWGVMHILGFEVVPEGVYRTDKPFFPGYSGINYSANSEN
jgi:hypothetical protein